MVGKVFGSFGEGGFTDGGEGGLGGVSGLTFDAERGTGEGGLILDIDDRGVVGKIGFEDRGVVKGGFKDRGVVGKSGFKDRGVVGKGGVGKERGVFGKGSLKEERGGVGCRSVFVCDGRTGVGKNIFSVDKEGGGSFVKEGRSFITGGSPCGVDGLNLCIIIILFIF